MIIDKLFSFEPTTGTPLTASADSTDILDLINARDLGIGDTPALLFRVQTMSTAFTDVGSDANLTLSIQYSADNVTYHVAAQSVLIGFGNMLPNRLLWEVPMPRTPIQIREANQETRYIKARYTVGNGPFTAGLIWSGIVLTGADFVAYPPGIVIAN